MRLPLLLALVASLAHAQTIYVWVDDEGNEHFTDDRSAIPRGAKVRTTEGEHISSISMERTGASDGGVLFAELAPPSSGPDEATWRRLFSDAHERIATLRDQIELDRRIVETSAQFYPGGPVVCVPYGAYAPGAPGSPLVATPGQLAPGVVVNGQVRTPPPRPPRTRTPPPPPPPVYAPGPCYPVYAQEFENARQRLALNQPALARAEEALADLERRASFEAVPNEWRR
jgi:hypothetical protein